MYQTPEILKFIPLKRDFNKIFSIQMGFRYHFRDNVVSLKSFLR